jgi:regulatory protein
MRSVTGIIADAKRSGRFVVELEGAPYATVSLDVLTRFHIAIGATIDDETAGVLLEEAAALGTYDRALGMLALQPRSARDLRRRLVLKGERGEHADAAIERLVSTGLLDDTAFARQLARSKAVGQGASKRRLQQEMFKRGVARDVGDAAIESVFSDESLDEAALIEGIARKKLRSLGGVDAGTRRRRLYAFLARRGYEADAIRQAMTRLLAGIDGAGAADDLSSDVSTAGEGRGMDSEPDDLV